MMSKLLLLTVVLVWLWCDVYVVSHLGVTTTTKGRIDIHVEKNPKKSSDNFCSQLHKNYHRTVFHIWSNCIFLATICIQFQCWEMQCAYNWGVAVEHCKKIRLENSWLLFWQVKWYTQGDMLLLIKWITRWPPLQGKEPTNKYLWGLIFSYLQI